MIPKFPFTKSDVSMRAWVANGSVTSELANKGIIAGIT